MIKIALVCAGLEHIQRGFESFSLELHKNFKSEGHTIDLVKGSGLKKKNEYSIRCIRRNSPFLRLLPNSKKGTYLKYRIECWSMALSFLPFLRKHRYSVIHTSDNEFGKAMKSLSIRLNIPCKILFSNGAPWEAHECKQFDMVQEVTRHTREENIKNGVNPQRSVYVPYGIQSSDFNTSSLNISQLKEDFRIPLNKIIILSLSALKITHKRLDYLISEYKKLGNDFYLVMAGGEDEETASLKELASSSLESDTYQFLTVRYDEVKKLLACADIFVSTSLSEAFGRVLIEASSAKVPVLCHPHYAAKEILGHQASFVDMSVQNSLSAAILNLANNNMLREEIGSVNYQHCVQHFDWSNLNQEYIAMYNQAIVKNEN